MTEGQLLAAPGQSGPRRGFPPRSDGSAWRAVLQGQKVERPEAAKSGGTEDFVDPDERPSAPAARCALLGRPIEEGTPAPLPQPRRWESRGTAPCPSEGGPAGGNPVGTAVRRGPWRHRCRQPRTALPSGPPPLRGPGERPVRDVHPAPLSVRSEALGAGLSWWSACARRAMTSRWRG